MSCGRIGAETRQCICARRGEDHRRPAPALVSDERPANPVRRRHCLLERLQQQVELARPQGRQVGCKHCQMALGMVPTQLPRAPNHGAVERREPALVAPNGGRRRRRVGQPSRPRWLREVPGRRRPVAADQADARYAGAARGRVCHVPGKCTREPLARRGAQNSKPRLREIGRFRWNKHVPSQRVGHDGHRRIIASARQPSSRCRTRRAR